MTKTKVNERKRVVVKLNPTTFKQMVHDITKDIYGTGSYGELQYCFHDTAVTSLRQASQLFLEDMWEHVRHLSNNHNNVVTVQDIRLWKRVTDFKLRFKRNNLSLCELLNK